MFNEIQMGMTGVMVPGESLTSIVSKMPLGRQRDSCVFALKAFGNYECKTRLHRTFRTDRIILS